MPKQSPHSSSFALTSGQRAVWILQRVAADTPLFNLTAGLEVKGPGLSQFVRGFMRRLVQRHSLLRCRVSESDTSLLFEPEAFHEPNIQIINGESLDETELANQIEALHSQPFDLTSEPPLRARLISRPRGRHVVLITVHHIVADEWSAQLIYRDVERWAGNPARLLKPVRPAEDFAEFALEEERWLASDEADRSREYWREVLNGSDPHIDLPTDFAPADSNDFSGATIGIELERSLSERVRALASELNVSRFSLLFAAWQLFIARIADRDDIAIATPFLNRPGRRFRRTMGLFTNPVTIRIKLGSKTTFIDATRSVFDQIKSARRHQRLPFEHVLRAVGAAPDPVSLPFQQASFQLRRGAVDKGIGSIVTAGEDAPTVRFGPWSVRSLGVALQPGHTTLALDLFDDGETFTGLVKFQASRYRPATIEAWRDGFVRMLSSLVAAPNAPWHDATIFDGAAPAALAGGAPVERDWIADWRERAASAPEELAVTDAATGAHHRYGDVAVAAQRFGSWVSSLHIGGYVALCLPRNVDLPARVVGLLEAGVPFVPIDPMWPRTRVEEVIADCGATLVLSEGQQHQLPQSRDGVRIVRLDDPETLRALADWDEPLQPAPTVSNEPAYLMYTSGSTGAPTGIVTTRANFAAFVSGFIAGAELSGPRRFLARTALSFDPVFVEILLPLVEGGHIVLLDDDRRNDPAAVVDAVDAHDIQVLQATPSFWPMLLAEGLTARGHLRAISGGEALSRSLAQRVAAAGLEVWNAYGPTETTIWVTAGRWHESDSIVALGRPLPGVTLSIRDQWGQPLPPGAPGELCVSGPFVSPGYITANDKTREKFLTDSAGERYYRTGDRARLVNGSEIEFLGRRDLQVKLRGYRVELEEIEAQASALPSVVRAAAVVAGEESVILVVEVQPGFDVGLLREHLGRHLPSYLRPQRIATVDRMPTSTAHKIDRPAVTRLANELASRAAPSPAIPSSSDAVDDELLSVWRDLLGDDTLGENDDLIERGANSLTVMRALTEIHQRFGVRVSMREVYETATIRQIAEQLRNRLGEQLEPAQDYVAPVFDDSGAPLASLTQERLWMVTQLPGANVAYNIVGAVQGMAQVDESALNAALRDIMNRHEMLRASFDFADGALRQIIAPPDTHPAPIRLLNFPGDDATAFRAAVNHVRHEGARSFELTEAPLFKLLVCKVGSNRTLVAGVFHHLIFDGWSVRVFADDLMRAYEARLSGSTSLPLVVGRPYAEFAAWQRQWIESAPDTARQLSYWQERLDRPSPPLTLPTDRPRPPVPTYRGAYVSALLPTSLSERLNRLAGEERATLFHVLYAALAIQLWRYSAQRLQTIGVPVAGRHFPGLDNVVGCLINTLALRVDLDPQVSFRKLLRNVRRLALEALDHQDLPLTMLMEHVAASSRADTHPLFQVVLTLQNFEHSAFEFDDIRLSELDVPNGGAQFDLTYYLRERDDGLHCFLEYNADLFEPDTAARILAHYEVLLNRIATTPDALVADAQLMTEEERREALTQHSGHEQTWPEQTLVELLDRQVEPSNTRPAVTTDDTTLSYEQLNRQANAIACTLADAGVVANNVVAVALNRDQHMVPWLLGIVRAGAAWLPIDPHFPGDRIAFMLQDSGCSYVVTTRALAESLDLAGRQVWYVDEPLPTAAQDSPRPTVQVSSQDLAYLIYTSGSTGQPKGVRVSHSALTNFLRAMADQPGINDGDTLLAVTTLSFDIANLEIFGPLITGARVVVAGDSESRDPQALDRLITSEGITVMQATPSTWRMMIDAGWNGARIAALCGGESLSPDLAKNLLSRVGVLWNMYGPTEATIWCACGAVESAEKPISLGRPLPNNRLYIVDESLDVVPPGVVGELVVGGDNLALGYHQRPDIEAERFIEHDTLGRIYRTGDRVRTDSEGRILYVGRVDDQIKVRGHRLEPVELESSINALPEVKESAVMLHTVRPGDDRLVAFVVPASPPVEPSVLRKSLMRSVPPYLVPQYFVATDALPKTPNAKIDRGALRVPELAALNQRATYSEPETDMERRLASIWAELLNIEKIDRHDNFFELGGHSLAAVQVIGRFHKMTGQIISPQALVVDRLSVIASSVERRRSPNRDADIAS